MTTLSEKAMLVGLHIRHWSARKYDRSVSDKVAEDNAANREAGRYNKMLIARNALDDIIKAISKARGTHYDNTLPWTDDGFRILPASNYFEYMAAIGVYKRSFERAVDNFIGNYEDYKQQAEKVLGRLFREKDYPRADSLSTRFLFEIKILPMPASSDFRVGLQAQEVDRIREDIEARMQAAQEAAMRDVWKRIHHAVSRMHDKLSSYGRDPETNKISVRFQDTLVGNLRDLTAILPRLNLTGDPELERISRRLETTLCIPEAQQLREDGDLRRKTAKEAKRILDQMAGYVNLEETKS